MTYLVIDYETTVRDLKNKNKANPFYPDNKVVLGSKIHPTIEGGKPRKLMVPKTWNISYFREKISYIVGQNLGFDLHYARKGSENLMAAIDEVRIWDTQVAEYVLTGQMEKYASLDRMAEKYGGVLKPDWPREQWDAGVQTEDMDLVKLQEYCDGDVENTEIVFLNQYKLAEDQGKLPLILALMESKLATWEMEWNGLFLDRSRLETDHMNLSRDVKDRHEPLEEIMLDSLPSPIDMPKEDTDILSSGKLLSLLFFGGSYVVTLDKPVLNEDGSEVRFKSGKRKGLIKTRKTKEKREHKGWFGGGAIDELSKKNGRGYYGTDEEVIDKLVTMAGMMTSEYMIYEFLKSFQQYKKDKKMLSTYIEPYLNCMGIDDLIHAHYNHCVTVTGRLSSSDPNFQNIPRE